MLSRINKSIVVRSAVINSALFLVLFITISIGIYYTFYYLMLEGSTLTLEDNSEVISRYISEGHIDMIPAFAEDTVLSVEVSRYEGEPYDIYDTRGTNLYHFFTASDGNTLYEVKIEKSLENDWRYFIPFLFVLIAALIILAFFIMLISTLTIKRIVEPIHNMIQTIRSGTLDIRLDAVDAQDELRVLAETINGLLDRIWETYYEQDRFVSDASHELKTPLLVIQGYADLLDRWGMEDPDVQKEAIANIKRETEYMTHLIERLLFLAKADQNRLSINPVRFCLAELLGEIVNDFRMIDDNHNYSLNSVNVEICADQTLVKQAILILLDNSKKYTPSGGNISVNITVDESNVSISVCDNGIGVSKEDLPHLFDRFYKADKSRNRSNGGVGLGLSIANLIVSIHHGEISVSCENGETVFTLCLPIEKAG